MVQVSLSISFFLVFCLLTGASCGIFTSSPNKNASNENTEQTINSTVNEKMRNNC